MTCNLSTDCRHQKTRVRIPAWHYNIDRSELEITCHYSNSRAPGGSFATYNIKPRVDGPKTGRNFGGRQKKRTKFLKKQQTNFKLSLNMQ